VVLRIRLTVWTLVLIAVSGCAHQTRVQIPSCVKEIDFAGEHTRIAASEFVLNHFWDFPLTKTTIRIQDVAGETQEHTFLNNRPDWARVLLSIPVGVLSGAFMVYGINDLMTRGESFFHSSTLFTLTAGTGSALLGAGMLLTGWHPQEKTIILSSACEE
jgi:hypothetical protein